MNFCGLGNCLGWYMRGSGSSVGDSSVELVLEKNNKNTLGPSQIEQMGPIQIEQTIHNGGGRMDYKGSAHDGLRLGPSGSTYNTITIGNLVIVEETKEGVSNIKSIRKSTENGQELVNIKNRSEDGKNFYLRDRNGYEAILEMKKDENGSNQYNLISPSDFIFELLENDGCRNIKKLSESDSIEINGNEYGYSDEFNKAEYAVPREQNAVCSGSAVVRFDEQNGFIKPQYMLHGFNTVMTQTRGPYTRTYSGTFEKGDLSKGKITLKNLIQDETIFIIEGKFVAQEDKVPKLEGIGTVDVGPYQLSGNFEKGRLVFDGEQKVLKKNKLQDLGPIMPERCDMKNSLTFRDGDKRVVVTFNPKIGYYSYKIS